MRKLLVLIIGCLTASQTFAQVTAVPDPNFEAFLEANGMGDGIPDNGQVLTANIENVTVLDLPSFAGISDLTGIEDFSALEFLDFSANNVVSVDLSQNIALTTLGCIFNQLTILDLSNNTQLEWISCQNNQLSTLLLNSENLSVIECWENQLTELDVSQATALTMLDCHINLITQFDISQNSNLTQLNIWANALTSLDVSNNEQLTYINCSYNNIQNLNISLNVELGVFLAANIPELTYLDMRNGNNEILGSVNVFGTDDLQCIFVDDASAPYLEDWFKDPFTTFVNNEAECDALDVSVFNKDSFLMYPNPAQEHITISVNTPTEFTLYSSNGAQIRKGVVPAGLSRISLSDLSSGLYFISVYTPNGTSIKKIIKN
ncbi:T9SS type A sorting domain-containing protein [Aequorivita nionensis]|jgi:hypothetical protein|uniref:T9SS type A sorting domain-containing protein n=1 Tax=Aequorivita nionensis TaxID=1287690 RepID=UPI003965BFFB